jgi:ABC-type molybdate transport system substrate-binding protein
MDIYTVSLFGLIGLVVALILTGGLVSMLFGEEPSMSQLGAGATVGAAAGAAVGFTEIPKEFSKVIESLQSMQSGGSSEQEMKTGLPTF